MNNNKLILDFIRYTLIESKIDARIIANDNIERFIKSKLSDSYMKLKEKNIFPYPKNPKSPSSNFIRIFKANLNSMLKIAEYRKFIKKYRFIGTTGNRVVYMLHHPDNRNIIILDNDNFEICPKSNSINTDSCLQKILY